MTDTREPPGGAPAAAPTTDGGALRRADDIQLIGEMAGSGYRVPPSLVRRGDGQTVQLTPLLYALLESIDGERDVDGVAAAVSERTGRAVTADNVSSLVDGQLRPLGLLTRPDGSQPEVKRSNPLLGLRLRWSITDPERTRRLTTPFAALFHPLVAVPLLAAFGVVCWWVFFRQGLAQATYEAFEHPGLLLLVFGVTILSAGFHEFGHAAAARRGGATPGVMGAGLYLVWPAFYTDVTDSYRLGRGGRVLTDLGGLYFNAIVAVAITGVWWVTGYEALLLVVATQILQMLQQLTPLVRFDGYHVLADVTGVPDLFHRIKPTLLGALPVALGRPRGQAAEALGPRRDHALGRRRGPDAAAGAGRDGADAAADPRHRLGTAAVRGRAARERRRRRRLAAGDRAGLHDAGGDPAGRRRALHAGAPRAAGRHGHLAAYVGQAGQARHRRRDRPGDGRRAGLGVVAEPRHLPPDPARRARHRHRPGAAGRGAGSRGAAHDDVDDGVCSQAVRRGRPGLRADRLGRRCGRRRPDRGRAAARGHRAAERGQPGGGRGGAARGLGVPVRPAAGPGAG